MSAEKPKPKVLIQTVTFEDLQEIGIEAHLIAQLTADDLISITHKILLHLNHDVFPYELKWQVHELLDEREED